MEIMRNPVEIFDELLAHPEINKRRYHPIPRSESQVFDAMRKFAENWVEVSQSHPRNYNLVPIHFDYIDDGGFNAFATIREKHGFIGVFRGAILLGHDLFHRMLAHPNVLPYIGDRSLESVNLQHSEGLYNDFVLLMERRKSEDRTPFTLMPRDVIRAKFAGDLLLSAMDFLVMHEIIHITHGHVGYIGESIGLSHIMEVSQMAAPAPAVFDPIVRQALEMDADCNSIAAILSMLRKFEKTDHVQREDMLYKFCFALAGIFHLWGWKIDHNSLDREAHPPVALRYLMCVDHADRYLKRREPELHPAFMPIANKAFHDSWRAIDLIGGDWSRAHAVASTIDDERSLGHLNRLSAKWAEIRPDVARFSFWQPLL